MGEQSVTTGSRKKNRCFKAFKRFITGKKSKGSTSRALKDENSFLIQASPELDANPTNDEIHIALLLINSRTRRFEILQLHFDSRNAKVEDIFSQISTKVIEPSLKNQTYVDICTPTGYKLDKSKILSDYVAKAAVLIAVPVSETPDEGDGLEAATKMAKPLLGNPKVEKILSAYFMGLEIGDGIVDRVGKSQNGSEGDEKGAKVPGFESTSISPLMYSFNEYK